MKFVNWSLAGLCALSLGGLTLAQSDSVPSAPRPEEIVLARQSAMNMSGALRGYMKLAIQGGAEAKKAVYPADGLAKWAKALPAMFPRGTGPDALKTAAKAEVWTDRAGFNQAAADYIAATMRLSQLAHANDADGFRAQLDVVGKSCTACHDKYQTKMGD